MAYNSAQYLQGRVKYQRPSAMLWSENAGSLVTYNDSLTTTKTVYVPIGYEINANTTVNVTGISGSGTVVTYTANNLFNAGDYVVITGSSISGFNGTFLITTANATTFTVANTTSGTATTAVATALSNFLIISDHNRSSLDFKTTRLEKRERMITGRMRSFWTADKLTLSVNWNNLPSRAYHLNPQFDLTTGNPTQGSLMEEYTVDGGAGGAQMLDWYENHTGSFYVYLSYDKYPSFAAPDTTSQYAHLKEYSQVMEMFISDFSYSVQKRGGSNFDLWNISLTLEEA
jgi:hypothetical protein